MDSIRSFFGVSSGSSPKSTLGPSLEFEKDSKTNIDILVVCACMSGNLEELKQLVEQDPGIVNNSFIYDYDKLASPLYLAARSGHYDLVEFLIHSSADINALNNGGNSPAFAAAVKGHTEIVKLLVKHGVDVNQKYEKCLTLLTEASRNGDTKLVEFLLKTGANINQTNSRSVTPLFIAACNSKNGNVVRLLAAKGGILGKNDRDSRILINLSPHLKTDMLKLIDHVQIKEKID